VPAGNGGGGGGAAFPVPVSEIVCGLPAALSVSEMLAVSVPVPDGVNVTEIVQLAPALSNVPHVFDCEKSPECAPVIAIPAIESEADPTFVTVTVCGVLEVPTVWLANVNVVGLNETAGAVFAPPIGPLYVPLTITSSKNTVPTDSFQRMSWLYGIEVDRSAFVAAMETPLSHTSA